MGKAKRPDKRPTPRLSAEDAELWERVAGTAKPLTRGKNRNVELPDIPVAPGPDDAASTAKQKKNRSTAGKAPAETRKPASPPPLGTYDRGEVRAIAGGKLAIEGRIDLHGLRRHEAHTALRTFLLRSQARGHRHVLVITGKGGRFSDDEGPERGVLSREVPRWLGEPEFRQVVVGFAPAHKRHGGEGALYVRLRKSRQS